MKDTIFKKYFNLMHQEKINIYHKLYNEYGLYTRKNTSSSNAINIIYHNKNPYTIIANKRKFLYKQNIAQRTDNKLSFNNIKQDYERCFDSVLLPNILSETENFYEVTYFDEGIYKNIELRNIHLFDLQQNKRKINDYCEIIQNNKFCIIDFDLQNFMYNVHTKEIYLTYSGDMEKIDFFNPNILSIDTPNNKSLFLIKKNVEIPKYNLINSEYVTFLNKSYSDYDIKFL